MNIYDKYILPRAVNWACKQETSMRQRMKVIPLATGSVLEIGVGSGLNLPLYDKENVKHLTAIEPSKEDLDIAKVYLDDRVEMFKEATNDTSFILNNSDTKNFDFSKTEFPEGMDSIVNLAQDGDVIGPYRDGESFKLAKVIKNGFEQFYNL